MINIFERLFYELFIKIHSLSWKISVEDDIVLYGNCVVTFKYLLNCWCYCPINLHPQRMCCDSVIRASSDNWTLFIPSHFHIQYWIYAIAFTAFKYIGWSINEDEFCAAREGWYLELTMSLFGGIAELLSVGGYSCFRLSVVMIALLLQLQNAAIPHSFHPVDVIPDLISDFSLDIYLIDWFHHLKVFNLLCLWLSISCLLMALNFSLTQLLNFVRMAFY